MADYNNRPPNFISFVSAVDPTSGPLHCEFGRILFIRFIGNRNHGTTLPCRQHLGGNVITIVGLLVMIFFFAAHQTRSDESGFDVSIVIIRPYLV